jgi:transposase
MVFDAHERAFGFFKGACGRGVYDNMKTAVETIFIGKDRQYNRRFDGFHALPASVSKTCLVRFDNNKYSVSASAVGRPVDHSRLRRARRDPAGRAHRG